MEVLDNGRCTVSDANREFHASEYNLQVIHRPSTHHLQIIPTSRGLDLSRQICFTSSCGLAHVAERDPCNPHDPNSAYSLVWICAKQVQVQRKLLQRQVRYTLLDDLL